MPMLEPILVTGIARSGTSLVANIINNAGAQGGKMTLGTLPEQPTGFYENDELNTRVDKRILFDLGFDPRGQSSVPGPNIPSFDISVQVYNIIRGQGVDVDTPWFFKDCKALLLHRSYLRSFPNSKWVLVRRNSSDIVKSCMRASFMTHYDTPEGWAEWVAQWMRNLNAVKKQCPYLREVWYENLVAGNYGEIKSVIEWLGLNYNEEYLDKIIIKR